MHDGKLLLVREGQIITGRKELSRATGIPETTIERILKMLENEHQIGQQKTNKYRVITILNWKEHQDRTQERTTNGQQTDTYKNDKKDKTIPARVGTLTNSSSGVEEIRVTEDGKEIVPKPPKDLMVEKASKYWHSLCRREAGLEPSGGLTKTMAIIKRANKSVSHQQIKAMMDLWFETQTLETHEMIQITRCLSPQQVDKYLAENL